MPRWLRRTFTTIAWILMATFAYTPTVETSLVRDDFECLASAAELCERGVDDPAALYRVAGTDARPLAAASILASHACWSDDGGWSRASALPLRFEQVALVLLTALGLALFVRRLMLPWMGSEQAEAAAWAVALFVSLHPFHLAAVANLATRGDLLATALGSWACVSFLGGRQERSYGRLVVAGVLSFLASLASPLALALPVVFGLTEFVSAHRYRPLAKRKRTALTTFVVFGGCIALDPILRHSIGAPAPAPVVGENGWFTGFLIAVEKLGLLLLPINVSLVGVIVYAIAGALVLLAVQPALVAARSAPRHWGWILSAWTVFLVASGIPGFEVRVHPSDLSESAVLYPTATVMAVGLAVSATALPGLRRWLTPLGLACCFAVLAHMNGLPWKHASQAVEILRDDLARAQAQHGGEPEYLVLDPPTRIERIDGLGRSLPRLARPPFAPAPGARVRGLPLEAFSALMRARESSAYADEFVVLVPRRGTSRRTSRHEPSLVPVAGAATEPPRWTAGEAPVHLDLDPRSARALVVTFDEAVPTHEPPRLAWRTTGPDMSEHRLTGVWTPDGRALFDLYDEPAWLVSDRVDSIWSDEGGSAAGTVELRARLPRLGSNVAPRPTDDDWRFELDATVPARPPNGEGGDRERWTLELFEPRALEYACIDVDVRADGALVAPEAEEWTRRVGGRGGELVVWTLARRLVERRTSPVAADPTAPAAETEPGPGVAIAEATGHRRFAASR